MMITMSKWYFVLIHSTMMTPSFLESEPKIQVYVCVLYVTLRLHVHNYSILQILVLLLLKKLIVLLARSITKDQRLVSCVPVVTSKKSVITLTDHMCYPNTRLLIYR